MDQLNILDRKILLVLQSSPLEPYSKLAEKLNTSTQTTIRRVNSLIEKGILNFPIASFVPERIQLSRYIVTFNISSLHQFTLLQMSLAQHNYIRSYNRFYGEKYGMLANFDIPEEGIGLLTKFCNYLVEEEFCDSFEIDKATGYRVNKPEPLPNYTRDPEVFNIVSFWQKKNEKSENLPRLPSAVKLDTLEPIHMLLLRDLTSYAKNGHEISIRTKQTELITHYNDYYRHLGKKIRLTDTEQFEYDNLKDFFDNRSKHNAKVDFGRKYYNFVRHHLISNPRWNFSRKLFEQHVTRAFIIKDVPNKEKFQFFRFLSEENPPFQTGFELLNNGIFLRFTLPPYYDTKLNYLIWNTFKDYSICSLDFFGNHGLRWPFYINNFSWDSNYWKTDDDWFYQSAVTDIEDNLKNNNFGDFKMNKHVSSENGNGIGSYLNKHISNGNTTATTP